MIVKEQLCLTILKSVPQKVYLDINVIQMDQIKHLEHLRHPEIKQLIGQGWTTVIFACGAVEQHGPHLPLFVDAEHGSEITRRLADRMEKTLIAPTIRIGCSDHHMAFPGTITLRKSTFEAIVSDYVSSLAHHGFKRILIVPSHGGNFGPLKDMLPRLQEINPAVEVDAFTDVVALVNGWKTNVEKLVHQGDRVGGHADIAETAIMLHLHPELVRNDLAEEGFSTEINDEVIAKIISEGFHTVTPNGIIGDARGATPELGDQLINALVDEIIQYFA